MIKAQHQLIEMNDVLEVAVFGFFHHCEFSLQPQLQISLFMEQMIRVELSRLLLNRFKMYFVKHWDIEDTIGGLLR
jgi:hypothetical protein